LIPAAGERAEERFAFDSGKTVNEVIKKASGKQE